MSPPPSPPKSSTKVPYSSSFSSSYSTSSISSSVAFLELSNDSEKDDSPSFADETSSSFSFLSLRMSSSRSSSQTSSSLFPRETSPYFSSKSLYLLLEGNSRGRPVLPAMSFSRFFLLSKFTLSSSSFLPLLELSGLESRISLAGATSAAALVTFRVWYASFMLKKINSYYLNTCIVHQLVRRDIKWPSDVQYDPQKSCVTEVLLALYSSSVYVRLRIFACVIF